MPHTRDPSDLRLLKFDMFFSAGSRHHNPIESEYHFVSGFDLKGRDALTLVITL